MQIESITTENFKVMRGVREFDGLPSGIIGITGDNGQGKSTLMSAVAYALYGPEVLETGNQDVVSWGESKGFGEVVFKLSGSEYKVRRELNKGTTKAFMYRDGEKITSSPTVVNDEVSKLLGVDRVGFLTSVFSRQEDLLGIGSLQPAKRASTVLRLLGIDQVESAQKRISERSRDLSKQLSFLRDSNPEVMDEDAVKGPEYIAECEQILADLAAKKIDLRDRIDANTAHLAEYEIQDKAFRAWVARKSALTGEYDAARQESDRALAEAERPLPSPPVAPSITVDEKEYERYQTEYDSLLKSLQNSICPTCLRPYDDKDAASIRARSDEVFKWIQKNEKPYLDGKQYARDVELHEALREKKAEAGERSKRALRIMESKREALESLEPVESVEDHISALRSKQLSLNSEHSTVLTKVATVTMDMNHVKESLVRREEYRKRRQQVKDQIDALQQEVMLSGYVGTALASFKSSLIASIVPAITERASSLISELTEGRYSELSLTPQYEIEYRNDQGELKSFANLSGGEKDVFALALRLAIADLKAGSVGVLVLDEVLESLDASRQEATWATLERLSNRYNQVFVITHVDSFKDRAAYTITV